MPGLDPGIHVAVAANVKSAENPSQPRRVDGRDKPGHDEKDVKCDSPAFDGGRTRTPGSTKLAR